MQIDVNCYLSRCDLNNNNFTPTSFALFARLIFNEKTSFKYCQEKQWTRSAKYLNDTQSF